MTEQETKRAYFAGGCFWGVEYFLKKAEGVLSTRVGYMGGHKENPTQVGRQGPDVGEQYQSVIFYADENQKRISENLIDSLKKKGYSVSTKLVKAGIFWPAEGYHQDYYGKNGQAPYCHLHTKRF